MKLVLLPLISTVLCLLSSPSLAADRPNLLIILADDLGFSDLGCYGGEIQTPCLDGLAEHGLRFTQFYNTARCWPTRAALLTGYYAQQVRRDALPDVRGGGGGVRPAWARLLPDMLRPLGYRSYHSGKWHIDGPRLAGGFDRSYSLEDHNRFFAPRRHLRDDRPLPPVGPDAAYYATTAIADHAIRCLQEHLQQHADQPFFHYLAFTSPHFPLQAPPEDIERYRDVYRKGWNEVRQQRWERMQQMGLINCSLSQLEREVGPPYHFPDALEKLGPGEVNRPVDWETLTDEQREFQVAKMAVHAAMVDRMDRDIGRVLDQIRLMNALDDTLIVFLSDNGASAEIMVRGDGHDRTAAAGSAATFLCLGPGWSSAANTPFRRHKTWVHEGGIATPLVVHWPKGIAARGQLRHNPGHVIDLVPTLLDVAGGQRFDTWQGTPVPPPPGKSLVSVFQRDGTAERHGLWWLHEGNRAARVGNWKLVAARDAPWELYDLSRDRAESQDRAADHPEKVRELEQWWTQRTREFSQLARQNATKRQQPSDTPKAKKLFLPGRSFVVAGRQAFVLLPPENKRRQPQPWILYAPTLPAYPDKHETWMHQQFLAAGIAVAGIDVGEACGSAKGTSGLSSLYREMTEKRGYSSKPCLLGRSRGGLWVSRWAIENPDKVAGIAGIYPVFDLRTYPGLDQAAGAYDLTLQQLEQQLNRLNPIAGISTLAKARLPVFLIHGDDDQVVPLPENSAALLRTYQTEGAGDLVQLVIAHGQGHNFWEGFFRCQPLVDFVIQRARHGAATPVSNAE